MGSREGVAANIEKETKLRLEEMNRALKSNKEPVIQDILIKVSTITPELHKNYRKD